MGGNLVISDGTKMGKPRAVAVPATVWEVLREHMNTLEYQAPDSLVFPSEVATQMHPSSLRKQFKMSLRRAGMAPMRIHDLRGTAGSIRLEQGDSLKAVSDLLGHASITTTADMYLDILPAGAAESLKRLDRQIASLMKGGTK